MQRYEQYPFRTVLLCRVWNEHSCAAILEFLRAPEDDLDVGFSLQLQRDALARGGESEACRFLQTDSFQDMLGKTWEASCGTSLPVERKHAETKHNEKSRLCHLATASRNQIQRDVLRVRDVALQRYQRAEQNVKQNKTLECAGLGVGGLVGCRAHSRQ